jgi:ribonucleoside-diphosphate reductase alpha chain
MISAVFRVSDDSRFVVDELKEVFDPKGGAWVRGSYVASIVAEIGNVIERHMVQIGYVQAIDKKPAVNAAQGDVCPSCGSSDFKNEGGCETCISCGHSKCG